MTRQSPVLVIDDEDEIRDMVFLVLTEEGYRVEAVEDGAAALRRVRRETYGLILLDLHMPVMDGRCFAAAYQSFFTFQAPLVVMSAARDARSTAEQIGADAHVAKPLDFEILIQTVHRLALSDQASVA